MISMFQSHYIHINEKKNVGSFGSLCLGTFLFYFGTLTFHSYYFHFSIFMQMYHEINYKYSFC